MDYMQSISLCRTPGALQLLYHMNKQTESKILLIYLVEIIFKFWPWKLRDFGHKPSVNGHLSDTETKRVSFPYIGLLPPYRCNHFFGFVFFICFARTPTKSDICLKQRHPRCDVKIKPSSVAKTCAKFGQEILKYRISTVQILMSPWIHSAQKFYPSRTKKCGKCERSFMRAFRMSLLLQNLLRNW